MKPNLNQKTSLTEFGFLSFDFSQVNAFHRNQLLSFYKNNLAKPIQQNLAHVCEQDYKFIKYNRNQTEHIYSSYKPADLQTFGKDRYSNAKAQNPTKINSKTPKYSQKLSKIIHINFPNLQRLSFAPQSFQTLEGISFLYAPFLSSLDLSRNKVTSLKPLGKSRFRILSNLKLCHTQVTEISCLTRCQFPKLHGLQMGAKTDQLTTLFGRENQNDDSKTVFNAQDIRECVKIPHLFYFIVKLGENTLIFGQKLSKALKNTGIEYEQKMLPITTFLFS